jgi:hypothetical protein
MENLHLKNLDLTKVKKQLQKNKVKSKLVRETQKLLREKQDDVVNYKRSKRQKIIRNIIFIPTATLFSYFYIANIEAIKDTIVMILKALFSI